MTITRADVKSFPFDNFDPMAFPDSHKIAEAVVAARCMCGKEMAPRNMIKDASAFELICEGLIDDPPTCDKRRYMDENGRPIDHVEWLRLAAEWLRRLK